MDKALVLRVMAAMQDKLSGPLKKIEGNAAASAVGVVALRDKLKTLNAAQRDIGAFRDLSRGLQSTQAEMSAAQQKVAGLAQQIRATDTPTRAMTRAFDAAVRSAQQLKAKHGEQSQALQLLRDRLSTAGISTGDLAQHERRLRQGIASTNQQLSEQAARLKAVADRQERVARAKQKLEGGRNLAAGAAVAGAGGLGGAYALSRPLSAMVEAFAPAEDAATQLKVSLMAGDGSVTQDFERITELATKLGDKLPGTTADFQNMMTMLRRQGMSSTSILGGLGEATAYLGVLLKMPVTESAEFAAKMQDATRTAEKDMMGLMDVIQRTFYIGVDSNNMLNGFTKLSPVLGIIRKDGLEASKMLAPLLVMMDQTGMAGESAGNALRKVFQSGLDQKKVDKTNAMIKSAGFKFKMDFTDGKGEFGGLEQMFAQLDKLKGLNSVQRTGVLKQLFGDDAETLQVVATLMSKGIDGYKEVVGKMEDQGSLQQRVNEQLGTLPNVAEAAQGSFSNALSAVGATVAPDLKALLTLLGDMAAGFGKWVKENPAFVAAAVKVLAVVAALAAVLGSLALGIASVLGPMVFTRYLLAQVGIKVPMLSAVFGKLGGALKAAGGAVLALGRFLLMTPFGLLITAIGTAAYVIYQYWEPISAFFHGIWTSVRGAFDSAVSSISALLQSWSPMETLGAVWSGVQGFFGDMWTQVLAAFSGGIGGIAALLVNWSPLGLVYQAITTGLAALGIELPGKFTEFGGMLMQGLIKGVTDMAAAVKETISNMGGAVIGWFKEKLGIASPSREFIGLGEFVSEGAAVGITRQQPAAVKAAQALAASVAIAGTMAPGSVALAAPGGVTGASAMLNAPDAMNRRFDMRPAVTTTPAPRNVTIQGDTITIQINGAGASPADIGRAVEDALRRRDADKAARARSSFYDPN